MAVPITPMILAAALVAPAAGWASDPADVLDDANERIEAMQDEAAESLEDERLKGKADQEEQAERLPDEDDPVPAVSVPTVDVEAAQASQEDTMERFLDRVESGDMALPGRDDVRSLADGDIRLVAFASFSMPDESLKNLIVDTNAAGGVVVMQGLHENDWQATTKKVREIVGLETEFEYDIDPRLFVALGIERVPTLALVEKPQSILEAQCSKGMGVCEKSDADQLPAVTVAGDVSLSYAMKTIERRAEAPEWQNAAAQIRKRIEEDE